METTVLIVLKTADVVKTTLTVQSRTGRAQAGVSCGTIHPSARYT